MNLEIIENQFVRMGARFRVVRPDDDLPAYRRPSDYTLNIAADKSGVQTFEMQLTPEREAQLDVNVLQCKRHDRHLLLLVKTPEAKDRFLCGHDEREWFVAAVPGGASNVAQAKVALQPHAVQAAVARVGLSQRQRTLRHNRAFIRQGEWFFVPQPAMRVKEKLILRHEPISRGNGGKPHLVAELYRTGGEVVYICYQMAEPVTAEEWERIIADNPKARNWGWRRWVRGASVFARGAVRHRDHATITLHEWHEVLMNTEHSTRQMANVAFLD